ncbi:V-set and transmembrane domain-containing protein 2-like protein [Merluccius polli]|uniref:V-set and transmembrane domain-containing protein 2-like protein n=1 Tax=Merluccius polli TaxID=89951 RepID=A0AA47NZ29_MERPO|nr:V-set and transmembrane domain-containing protein 2-like protein [Merluccius polli]
MHKIKIKKYWSNEMGAFAVLVGTLHYMGLYGQLSASTRPDVENRLSGNGRLDLRPRPMFTEVPHDVRALGGQDVEMACSFRGAGTPSYSLEIQWWYIRNHPDWTNNQPWSTNEVSPGEGLPKDATKISVVKVAGSNISHKLRLSAVRPSDEGAYECRVIDFSDAAGARHHRARAYLQVVPQSHARDRPAPPANAGGHRGNDFEAEREGVGVGDDDGGDGFRGMEESRGAGVTSTPTGNRQYVGRHQGHGKQPSNHAQGHHAQEKVHHAQSLGHTQAHHTHTQGPHAVPRQQSKADEQSKRAEERDIPSDCPNEASCVP